MLSRIKVKARGSRDFLALGLGIVLGLSSISTEGSARSYSSFSILRLCQTHDQAMSDGMTAYQQQDYDRALESFNRAKAVDPKDVTARQYLTDIYRILHRFAEAEVELEGLIALQPKSKQWRLELAKTYLEQGKFNSALGLYQELLAQDSANVEANLGIAISLEGTDDIDSATDYYENVIRLAPGSEQAQQAESRLQRINRAITAKRTNKFFPIDIELGEAGLGWWDLRKMPIHVYIDNGGDVAGYRDSMKGQVMKALSDWSAASRGAIRFVFDPPDLLTETDWQTAIGEEPIMQRLSRDISDVPADPVPSHLHLHWVEDLTVPGGGQALGLAWTSILSKKQLRQKNVIIRKAHVWIATNRLSDGTRLPGKITPATARVFESHDRMVQEVITHELGHSLGLPHSPNPNDIMASGIYGLNAMDLVEARQLSVRDLKSLSEHYNNFEDSGLPSYVMAQLRQDAGTSAPPAKNESPSGAGENPLYGIPKAQEEHEKAQAASKSDGETADKEPSGNPSSGEPSTTGGSGPDQGAAEKNPEAAGKSPETAEKKPDEDKQTTGTAEEAAALDKKGEEKTTEDKTSEDKKTAEEDKVAEEEQEQEEAKALTGAKSAGSYDPLKEVIFEMNCRNYNASVSKLNKILLQNPKNSQAHYLLAVSYVMLHRYPEAATEYREVIKLVPNAEIGKMASEGLKKLQR